MRNLAISTVLLLAVAGSAQAQFTAGNVVVVRAGDGTAALSAASAVASLYEYLPNTASQGAPVSTLAMPTGANTSFTLSGSATSEGFLTMSANGQYLTMYGYGTGAGTASVPGTTSAAVPRVAGRINWATGGIDTSTRLTDAQSTNNARSVVSNDGTNFWTSGSANLTSSAGVFYATLGATTSTQLQNSTALPINQRVNNIFGGQLYTSNSSTSTTTPSGIYSVGTGLPTSGGPITPTLVLSTASTQVGGTATSPYDYLFFNLAANGSFQNGTVAYIADDRSITNNGGVQRWNYNGSTWTLAYILGTGTGSTSGTRGLAGAVDASGVVTLFATTTETLNRLIRIDDNLSNVTNGSAVVTTLATATTNTAFRGVEYLPVPTPGAAALLGLGTLVAARRRRA